MGTISSFNLGPAQEYPLQGTKHTVTSVPITVHLVHFIQPVHLNFRAQEAIQQANTTVTAELLNELEMIGMLHFGLRTKTLVTGGKPLVSGLAVAL